MYFFYFVIFHLIFTHGAYRMLGTPLHVAELQSNNKCKQFRLFVYARCEPIGMADDCRGVAV